MQESNTKKPGEFRREPIGSLRWNVGQNKRKRILKARKKEGNSQEMHREYTGHATHEQMQRCNRRANAW